MSKKDLQLKPSKFPTLAKSSVFPIKMLPKRKNVLDFLNKGTRWFLWEAHVVIFSGDQEHANVIKFAEAPASAHLRTDCQARPSAVIGIQTDPKQTALLYCALQEVPKALLEFL